MTFVLDAYMYTLKNWPVRPPSFSNNNEHSSQSSNDESSTDLTKKQCSEENKRFFGEYLMTCLPEDLLLHAKQVLRKAKFPHVWLGKALKSGKSDDKKPGLESKDSAADVEFEAAGSSDKSVCDTGDQNR